MALGSLDDAIDGAHQFLVGRVAPKAEPDARSRFRVTEPDCAQDVARPPRSAGASRPGGESYVAQVRHQARNVETFPTDVQVPQIAIIERAVDLPSSQTAPGVREQIPHMVAVCLHALPRKLRRSPEAGAKHRRKCAGTNPTLLPTAVHE